MKRISLLILAMVVVVTIMGCDNAVIEPDVSSDVLIWQCIFEPDIYIEVVSKAEDMTYCAIYVGNETGAVSILSTTLQLMLNDSHWRRIDGVTETVPLLGPPPPGWSDQRYSDRCMGIQINGSIRALMFVHTPIPMHDAIHVETTSVGE